MKFVITLLVCFVIFAISTGTISMNRIMKNPTSDEIILQWKKAPEIEIDTQNDAYVNISAKNYNYKEVIFLYELYAEEECVFSKYIYTKSIAKGETSKINVAEELIKDLNAELIDAMMEVLQSVMDGTFSKYKEIVTIKYWK